jgi:hypothetical protein
MCTMSNIGIQSMQHDYNANRFSNALMSVGIKLNIFSIFLDFEVDPIFLNEKRILVEDLVHDLFSFVLLLRFFFVFTFWSMPSKLDIVIAFDLKSDDLF